MRGFLLLLLVCSAVCAVDCSQASIASWTCMAWQFAYGSISPMARCSLDEMQNAYNEMREANCINCDKYFHCIANYNAVYLCHMSLTNEETARAVSNCREWGENSRDSFDDQVANRYGRNGGNCARRYLCRANCKYNPRSRTCRRSNCQ